MYVSYVWIVNIFVGLKALRVVIRTYQRERQKWLNQKTEKTVVIKQETKDKHSTRNTTLKIRVRVRRPLQKLGWFQMLRQDKQVSLHQWHPLCLSVDKVGVCRNYLSHNRYRNGFFVKTVEWYTLSFVKQIFCIGQPNHGGDQKISETMTWETLGSVAYLSAYILYQ